MNSFSTLRRAQLPVVKPTPGRKVFAVFILTLLAVFSTPAQAQVFKPHGMTIPGLFFSTSEQRARQACIDDRPECRNSIRAEVEQEMAISLVAPWILLAVAILSVLFWLRGQEKKKDRARLAARRHHDPEKFRKLDRDKTERTATADDEDEMN